MLDAIVNSVEASTASPVSSEGSSVKAPVEQNLALEQPSQVNSAPYISPKIRVDYETQQVVLEFRDSISGEVEKTVPSDQAASAYSRAGSVNYVENAVAITQSSGAEASVSVDISSVSNQQEVAQIEANTPNDTPSAPALNDGDTSSFA